MSDVPADEKAAFLVREGLVAEHGGERLLSTRAVAMLTGTSEDSWRFVARGAQDGRARITDAFGQDARRGAAEIRARIGSDDPFDVLYALATAKRALVRSAEVDEQLRALDG